MSNILAVDDKNDILFIIKEALESDGHNVTLKNSFSDVDLETIGYFDLILLDVMMDGEDGFSFLSEIRGSVDVPVIFLTAKTSEADVVEGFQSGADDYIKKPFAIKELRARIKAHLRREKREIRNIIRLEDIMVDLNSREITVNDEKVNFTRSEYDICEFLIKNRRQVFTREQIFEGIFPEYKESDYSVISEHIKNIRNKLMKHGKTPIHTIWGLGYKWE